VTFYQEVNGGTLFKMRVRNVGWCKKEMWWIECLPYMHERPRARPFVSSLFCLLQSSCLVSSFPCMSEEIWIIYFFFRWKSLSVIVICILSFNFVIFGNKIILCCELL
jgi:hypothetical protein